MMWGCSTELSTMQLIVHLNWVQMQYMRAQLQCSPRHTSNTPPTDS